MDYCNCQELQFMCHNPFGYWHIYLPFGIFVDISFKTAYEKTLTISLYLFIYR